MVRVRRPHRDLHREERQQGGDQVCGRVQRLGDQAEARGQEARDELQGDERRRRNDRQQRGALLRAHPAGTSLRGARLQRPALQRPTLRRRSG